MADLHVLLVGIDRHEPQRISGGGLIRDLQGCTADVERMEAFLRDGPLAVPAERIRKLASPPPWPPRSGSEAGELPTYRNLVREIEALGKRARSGDQVLIHYSGHGGSLPTVLPEKKGLGGRDECLVPCDAATPRAEGGGYLRDLEVHALLVRLAGLGLRVTLVLDCCHSGGVTRNVERGHVRGLGRVSLPPEPPGPLGSWEELAALLPDPAETPRRERFRHVEGASGWFPQPDGCVLLAACLPTEYAREYPFDGGAWSGALTHFLLDAMGDLGSRATYRWLHHRLLGRIRGLFEHQTPVLEGDGDVAFLGRDRWPERRGIPVLERAPDGRVLLGAGRAQGLGRGARLRVHAAGEAGEPVAELQVLEARATTCWATAASRAAGPRTLAAGDLAVVVDPGPDTRRYRVGTFARAGDEPAQRGALARVREAVASDERPLLVPAAAEAEADFLVEVTPGGVYRILDPSGEPLPHQGQALEIDDSEALERLLDRLEHLARFRAVVDLVNPDVGSPLSGRLHAELFAVESTEGWRNQEARAPVGAKPVPVGELLCLLVRNDSRHDLNVVVLDLQPDWGISRAHPNRREGDFTTLAPGAERSIHLRACLPEWMSEGRDRLKVIAATGPLDTTHLELDALGKSVGYRSSRGGRTRVRSVGDGEDLRTRLQTPSRTASGFRTVEAVAPVSHEWVVETVELGVVRASDRSSRGAGGCRDSEWEWQNHG